MDVEINSVVKFRSGDSCCLMFPNAEAKPPDQSREAAAGESAWTPLEESRAAASKQWLGTKSLVDIGRILRAMDNRKYLYGLLVESIEHQVGKLVCYRPSDVRLSFVLQK